MLPVALSEKSNYGRPPFYRLIQFCYLRSDNNVEDFFSYAPLVVINSMRAQPGAGMEITAGAGSFNRRANPKVYIDGILCPVSNDGVFHYTFDAPKSPGKYRKEVKIEYIDLEGKIIEISKDVVYSVVQ